MKAQSAFVKTCTTAKPVINDYFRDQGKISNSIPIFSQLLTKSDAAMEGYTYKGVFLTEKKTSENNTTQKEL